MANTAISGLTASASNLTLTDLLPVVQTAGVGPVKMTGAQIAAGLLGPSAFSAGNLRLGAADVATGAVAQSLTVQGNTGAAGPSFTIKGSAGSSSGGSILFQTHNGTSFSTALTLDASKNAIFAGPIFGTATYGIFDSAGAYYRMDANGVAVASNASFGIAASNTYSADVKMFRDSATVLRLENCLLLKGVAFASLPASPVAGTIAKITDSTVTTGAITGGGANVVLAYYKSTATAGWQVLAAL